MRTYKRSLLLSAVATIACGGPGLAQAQSQPLRQIDVPEEAASQGIADFARQADLQILAPQADLADKRTNAVHGLLTSREALRRFLAGTHLEVGSDDGHIITLRGAAERPQLWRIRDVVQLAQADSTPRASAAAPVSPQAATVAEVVVTGSSLRGVPPVGSNLTTLSVADIQVAPAQTAQEILTAVPAVGGFNMAGQGAFQSNDNTGADIPSIHGLGGSSSGSTLSLIDGHRFPLTGASHSLGDPNMVPPIAIQRVEVLADGASSVYGSDAVAGVINFITLPKFTGLEVTGESGLADHYQTYDVGVLAGTDWGSGNLYIAYNHSDRSDLLAADRSFTQANHTSQGGSNLGSFACQPATVQPAGSSLIYPYPYSGGGVVNKQANALCNDNTEADLLPAETRDSLMIKGSQKIGDRLTVTADVVYSNRTDTTSEPRGSVTTTIFGPGGAPASQVNPFYANVPGSNATSQTIRLNFDNLLGPGAQLQGGAQDFYTHVNLEYKLDDNWSITAFGVSGWDTSFARFTGEVCSSCADLALNGTTNGSGSLTAPSVPSTGLIVTQALTAANALDPYLPLSGNPTSAAVIAALKNNVSQTYAWQSINDVGAHISGNLFNLPAGPVKVAVGGEGVDYGLHAQTIMPLNTGPSSTGSAFADFPFPDRTVASAYGEALFPLISPSMSVPLVRKFDVNVSARYDHYSDFGSTENPRVGANWEIIDGLKLRANWATSFVAPQEEFQGVNGQGLNVESGYGLATQVANVPVSAFPEAALLPGCAHVAACTVGTGVVTGLQLNGGKPLQPELGKTYSVGADYTPAFIPGLRLGVTYWDNNLTGGITAPIASLAVGSQSLYSRFQFFPNGATPAQIAAAVGALPQTTAMPSKVYYIYDFRIGNVLNLDESGLDVTSSYTFPTSVGRFTIANAFTYLMKFNQQTGDGPTFSVLNTDGFNSTFPSIALNGRGSVGWSAGPYAFTGFVNYTGGYRNYSSTTVNPIIKDALGVPVGGGDKVAANVTVDLHLAYTVPNVLKKAQIYLDVSNLFDSNPPFFNSIYGYDPLAGNPIGRLITLGFRANFN